LIIGQLNNQINKSKSYIDGMQLLQHLKRQ